MASWRRWITAHPVGGSLLAGAIATHLATVFGIWFHGINLPDLNWPLTNGQVIFPKGSEVNQFWSGYVIHTLDGLVFAVLFALLLHASLPLPNNSAGNVIKGLIYGTILALVSALFMVPQVYAKGLHAGFLAHNFGWKFTLAIFVWHWVFGFFLGTVYNPLHTRKQ